jgi:hypothetical protein
LENIEELSRLLEVENFTCIYPGFPVEASFESYIEGGKTKYRVFWGNGINQRALVSLIGLTDTEIQFKQWEQIADGNDIMHPQELIQAIGRGIWEKKFKPMILETPIKPAIVQVGEKIFDVSFAIQYYPYDNSKQNTLIVKSINGLFPNLDVKVPKEIFNSGKGQIEVVNKLVSEYFDTQKNSPAKKTTP